MSTFASAFIKQVTTSSMAWNQIVGCFWYAVPPVYPRLLFAFCISNKRFLWQILLVHGMSGLAGMVIEDSFVAMKDIAPTEHLGIMLGLNEIFWILNETSTVIYSLTKLETVLESHVRKYVRIAIGILLLGYGVCRVQIGILRTTQDAVTSPSIQKMHSYAFVFLAVVEMIIFVLLAYCTVQHLRSNPDKRFGEIIKTLFTSSIPRISIIVLNTLLIVICGQFYIDPSQTLTDINSLAWAIKGSYGMILLFDVLTTKNKLMEAASTMQTNDSSQLPSFPKDSRV
ncbi:hypothetical protein HDV03_001907 [Kappamyces sp. JEL0829]|nr:hypothetical protein HDV03_001907 [Kappamyces sp. JEL0829]